MARALATRMVLSQPLGVSLDDRVSALAARARPTATATATAMSVRREASVTARKGAGAHRARKVGAQSSGCCCLPSTSAATTAPARRRTAIRRAASQREDVVIENLTEDYCDE